MIPQLIAAGASLAGGLASHFTGKSAANQQYQHQKEFAKSGIQWKVQDALKAGIHPLYAMGAQTTSYQPTSVGGSDFGLPDAGQNIGRAIDATRSQPASAMALRASAVQLDGLQLDNELKKVQLQSAIRLANQTQAHPALPGINDVYPLPGQGDSGVISSVPPGHETRAPQYTSPGLALAGRAWKRAPGTSDAQSWEDVYGDEALLPFLTNNYSSIRDIWENTRGPYRDRLINKLRR